MTHSQPASQPASQPVSLASRDRRIPSSQPAMRPVTSLPGAGRTGPGELKNATSALTGSGRPTRPHTHHDRTQTGVGTGSGILRCEGGDAPGQTGLTVHCGGGCLMTDCLVRGGGEKTCRAVSSGHLYVPVHRGQTNNANLTWSVWNAARRDRNHGQGPIRGDTKSGRVGV
jgi:hypothetical protein